MRRLLVRLCRRPPQLPLGRTSLPVNLTSLITLLLTYYQNWTCYCILLSEQLGSIPEFSTLGPLFKSADKPVELTESETEYVVRCIKHTFADHIVFQVRSDWSDVLLLHDSHMMIMWSFFGYIVAPQGPLQKVEEYFTQLSLIYPAREIFLATELPFCII